jgi:hypothetical protein
METMHPAGRRTLPPVPRTSAESPVEQTMELRRRDLDDAPVVADASDETEAIDTEAISTLDAAVALDPRALAVADEPELALEEADPAQHFVTRLRSAAAAFATAAGAETAVVREAVPPARHRRSRCRIVLRYPDGGEADLTFVGAVGRPGTPAWADFDQQIQRWLGTGQERQPAWLVADAEAPDGVAVDVPAWLAAG